MLSRAPNGCQNIYYTGGKNRRHNRVSLKPIIQLFIHCLLLERSTTMARKIVCQIRCLEIDTIKLEYLLKFTLYYYLSTSSLISHKQSNAMLPSGIRTKHLWTTKLTNCCTSVSAWRINFKKQTAGSAQTAQA